jgi:crotonobetainyl-CoA:carnitine CoA-transferase CaiB-like acyl-CoA transferase
LQKFPLAKAAELCFMENHNKKASRGGPHNDRTMIFKGLKVIDCASYIAAPAAATILADYGADVIKIEPPVGDAYRRLAAVIAPENPHNFGWLLDARNKKGLALNVAQREGMAVLRRLISQADVFITNFPMGTRQRLGLTYDKVAPLNERLIYASFTGYGEAGEEAGKPGFDSNAYWARSGLMDLVKPEHGAPPARSVAGMGDHPSALALYGAIVTALLHRERTGKGSYVGSSLLANGAWANGFAMQAALCGTSLPPRQPREKSLNALANHYQTRDGRWLILSVINEERDWLTVAKCLGREDLIADPRFASKPDRTANAVALTAVFDEVFAQKTLAEWRAVLDAAGLVFGIVSRTDDVVTDRQMRDVDVVVPFENDTLMTISSPMFIDGVDKAPPRRPPEIGEHTDAVLRAAGYDDDEIGSLRACGAVA